jgi:hypothetical protein
MTRQVDRSFVFEPGHLLMVDGEFYEVTGNYLGAEGVTSYIGLVALTPRQPGEVHEFHVPAAILRAAITYGTAARLWLDVLRIETRARESR